MDDTATLVAAAGDGDAGAWKELYQRYSGLVWAVARGYLVNDSDAQDVCQTTWYRFAEHLTRLREPERAGSWLATTARHEALRVLRTSGRSLPVGDLELMGLDADARSPEFLLLEAEEAGERAERERELWNAFEELPDRCRQLLRLLIADPRPSYQEIADGLGMPVGGIGPNRGRCLKRLAALMNRRGVNDIRG
ncbi:sigma-70 family RNA polymerase sigma factor [Nonomuraea sp. NPDC005650]|uniref:RNA polymerase sigma factor n=1 Tax=Nonomuraea sp. NPDC005650 TaxID=3157045 RepID=UPI0033B89988